MNRLLIALVGAYSVYALAKFGFFFILGYGARRKALDRAYAGRTSATRISDAVLLLFSILLTVLLVLRGAESTSFLTGLLVGMTLIQLYFHRFSAPLEPDEAPPAPVSPIKLMSYAIQARPGRAWKELIVMTVLIAGSILDMIWRS